MPASALRLVRSHLVIALAAVALMGLVVPTVAEAAGAPPTWKVVDLHDRRCYQIGGGSSPGSYAVVLSGSWTKPITIGIDDLAPGATATPLQSPIPAGSSDGTKELAYVQVGVARRQAVPGTYTMSLWASDGSTRRSVPVTLVEQTTRCVSY